MPRLHAWLAAASVATVIALLCAPMVAAFDNNELQQLVEAATTLDIDQRGITFTDDKCEHHHMHLHSLMVSHTHGLHHCRYCPNVTFGSDKAALSLQHLASTGANYVSIVVTQYMVRLQWQCTVRMPFFCSHPPLAGQVQLHPGVSTLRSRLLELLHLHYCN